MFCRIKIVEQISVTVEQSYHTPNIDDYLLTQRWFKLIFCIEFLVEISTTADKPSRNQQEIWN